MFKYFLFSVILGLMITCSYAQNKLAESPKPQPTLRATSVHNISIEDQVKHLEMRLEKLKSRQPAPTAEELQKVEMRLAERRKALAAEQAMKEKRQSLHK